MGAVDVDLDKGVTVRYAELLMCWEWGLAPWTYDRAPAHYRREMFKWWVFKNEREQLLRKQAEWNAQFGPKGRGMGRGR